MVESDWHSGDGLDVKILEITKFIAEIWEEEETVGDGQERKMKVQQRSNAHPDSMKETVRILARNWKRFMKVDSANGEINIER